MFFKILMFGIILGVGSYYFDLNTAEKKTRDAQYVSTETDVRCRQNHEAMCQYFLTVKLMPENLQYKVRVPNMIYRQELEVIKGMRFPVVFKQKKIFPATILGLAPKLQAEYAQKISDDK